MKRDSVAPMGKVYPPAVWRAKIPIVTESYRVFRHICLNPEGLKNGAFVRKWIIMNKLNSSALPVMLNCADTPF